MRLRPYKPADAQYLLSWFPQERRFMMWSAGKFTYPLTIEQLEAYEKNWREQEDGWIFTAVDDKGTPVGHLLMRLANYEQESVHFGFIVVDSRTRGRGYGKEMLRLAGTYAFEVLGMKRITLGVYAQNEAAHHCYRSVGFRDEKFVEDVFQLKEESWDLYEMAWEK